MVKGTIIFWAWPQFKIKTCLPLSVLTEKLLAYIFIMAVPDLSIHDVLSMFKKMSLFSASRRLWPTFRLGLAESSSIGAGPRRTRGSWGPGFSSSPRRMRSSLRWWPWPLDSLQELFTMIHLQRNDEILLRFERVNSEKERLKNDIEELRHIRYPIT